MPTTTGAAERAPPPLHLMQPTLTLTSRQRKKRDALLHEAGRGPQNMGYVAERRSHGTAEVWRYKERTCGCWIRSGWVGQRVSRGWGHLFILLFAVRVRVRGKIGLNEGRGLNCRAQADSTGPTQSYHAHQSKSFFSPAFLSMNTLPFLFLLVLLADYGYHLKSDPLKQNIIMDRNFDTIDFMNYCFL